MQQTVPSIAKRQLRIVAVLLAVALASGCQDDCATSNWTIVFNSSDDAANPLGPVASKEAEQQRLFNAIGRGVIAPAYAQLQACAQQLETVVQSHCTTPVPDQSALESAWRSAMRAWQRVQHIRVGPIEDDNRDFRMQFYPDSNEAVERGVDTALDGSDPLTQATIANKSVGVQGLPALEYLLFSIGGLDDAEAGPRRCELAGAVAANISVLSAEISAPWQEGGAFIEDFANARGDFLEADDVLVAILESLGFQSEFIADRKLKPALPAYRNVQGLESHYAEHTAANIAANLAAFRRLFDSSVADAYRLRDYLERAHDAEAVTALIAKELEAAEAALLAIGEGGRTLEQVVEDESSRDVEALYDAFQNLADLAVEAAVAAEVELGFNFQDGD